MLGDSRQDARRFARLLIGASGMVIATAFCGAATAQQAPTAAAEAAPAAQQGAPTVTAQQSAAAPEQSAPAADQVAVGAQQPAADASAEDNADIVVTGTSIRGVAPVGATVIAVGRDAIEKTAGQTPQQLLQAVPAVTGLQSAGQGSSPNFGAGLSAPIIHGLGASASNQTLVVFDGHRSPYMGLNHSLVDPNVIPPIAVQRVEVLADGASATYGSDAVAGVINFITRGAYDGIRVEAQAGFADQYDTRSFGAIAGKKWDSGFIWGAYNYSYRSALLAGDRPFTKLNHVDRGGTNLASYNCPAATIRTNGGLIYPSPYTGTIPATGAGLCDTSGVADLFPEERRNSLMLKVRQDLTDRLTVGADILYSRLTGEARNSRGVLTSTITTANPFFQSPVAGATSETVLWDANALLGPGARTLPTNEVFFVHPTAVYKLGGDWEFTANATIGWNTATERVEGLLNPFAANLALNGTTNGSSNPTTPSVPGTNVIVTQPLTAANALDVFRLDGNRTSAAVIASLKDYLRFQTTRHSIQNYVAKIDGSLFQLPAGPVKVALGAEYIKWRQTLFAAFPSSVGRSSSGQSQIDLRLGREPIAAYGELLIPVTSPDMDVFAANRVDLSIAGRYDHYNDVGGTFNPKFGANWEPVSGAKLHASYGTSFTAPSINSLGEPIGPWGINGESGLTPYRLGAVTVPYSVAPTLRGVPGCDAAASSCVLGTSIQGAQIDGGNRFLVPQTGNTWSAGLDLTPREIPGLAISGTFWSTKIKAGSDRRCRPPRSIRRRSPHRC